MDSASADPKPVPPFAPPVYPEQLRHDLVDGHVLLRLNADARGIPDMASIQVIESTNDLFTVAVRNAIRTWRFDSAGEVRLAFRFITTGTNSSEAASGGKLTYSVDGKPVQPVVITTLGQRPEYFIDGRSCAPTGCFPPAGTEGQYRGPESSRDSGVASNMRVSRDTSPSDSLLAVVGYLQRKQAGRGFFVDGQMIDRQASSLSQMLRIVPGFKISPTGDGHTYAVQDASDRTDGCVNFYVDGALWQQSTPGDMDDHLSAAQVLAIEAYHRSESPWQFWPTGRPTCATIVIWTRSRVGGSRALGPPDNDTLYAHVVTGQTISTTVAQAEAEGASFPREDAPAVNQPFFAHAFAGIADRRCVVGQEGEDPHASGSLRSGEMIIRGRWNDPQGLKAGEDIEYDNLRHDVPSRDLQQIPTRTIENKLLWAPLHGGALQGTPLVLRAARIGAPADTFRLSVAGLAHTPGPPPGREYGYPSLVTFPTPGQWLVVATAGSDWGCFVLNVAKPH